jgi:hypothetical protein
LSDFFRVDARQQLVDGRRLSRLRQEDLHDVAKAICGYERRLVRAEGVFSRHVAYYRFKGRGLDCLVLATDYAQILPFVQDGTFDPNQYPAPPTGNPSVPADLSTIDQWDSVFFTRVLGRLRALFPESYPTSDL